MSQRQGAAAAPLRHERAADAWCPGCHSSSKGAERGYTARLWRWKRPQRPQRHPCAWIQHQGRACSQRVMRCAAPISHCAVAMQSCCPADEAIFSTRLCTINTGDRNTRIRIHSYSLIHVLLHAQVACAADITSADTLIFPGVGSFGQAMDVLTERKYLAPLRDHIEVCICLCDGRRGGVGWGRQGRRQGRAGQGV